jgi:hypothetical protein
VRAIRLIVFVAITACWPSTAHASWLSWLEELSGPGPFHGTMFTFTVACIRSDELKACPVGDKNTRQTIVVRFGRFTSVHDEDSKRFDPRRFKDLPKEDPNNLEPVHAVPVSALWLFRMHRSLDVGGGIGFMRVSGNGFDAFSKISLTPLSASLTPLAIWSHSPWARVVRLELDSSFFPQGFKGSDFNNLQTTFDSGPEVLTRGGLVFDLGAVGGGLHSLLNR